MIRASQMAQMVKNPLANAGDTGLIPGLGRSPGEGNGNLLQYFAWRIPWTEKAGGLYSPWGRKESDMTERLTHTHTHTRTYRVVKGSLWNQSSNLNSST